MLSKERIEQLVAMAELDGLCECANTRNAIELAVKESEAEAQARQADQQAQPQARELSDEEIRGLWESRTDSTIDRCRAVIAADRAIRPAAGMVSDQQDAARFRHMMDESGKWFCEEAYPAMMVGRLREVCDAAMIAAAQEPSNG